MNKRKIKIAIFASGNGSNTQAILEYFEHSSIVEISCIYSNNSSAYVLTRGEKFKTNTFIFSKDDFYKTNRVLNHLNTAEIDLIVLAGFIWLIPLSLVEKFTIINIHPSLLPNYGGKGMYGHFVHEEVIKNSEKKSGISIHYVNKEYDKGSIILQKKCDVLLNDTPELLAKKIHILEQKYYPKTILKIAQKLLV